MKVSPSLLITGGLALAGVTTAAVVVGAGDRAYAVAAPVAVPAAKPFAHVVSGAGLVEASTENIRVGTPLPGVVAQVYVEAGRRVTAGEPLFTLDTRQVDADIAARVAGVTVANTRIDELRALEREAQDQLAKVQDLPDARAVSREEIVRREIAAQAAAARVKVAQAALALAQAELAAAHTQRERMIVRAPVAGTVLQLNLRAGEFASAESPEPLLVIGDTRTLHVRVDIDENDAWRVEDGARAVAYVRGANGLSTPARFVRFEPLVIPKRSLTGAPVERVDTRVLQVLFAFDGGALPVYVGQQMDVMIEARPIAAPAIPQKEEKPRA
jgi:multidrug efflux pump subunit AcrA (membrane-fusion protein)